MVNAPHSAHTNSSTAQRSMLHPSRSHQGHHRSLVAPRQRAGQPPLATSRPLHRPSKSPITVTLRLPLHRPLSIFILRNISALKPNFSISSFYTTPSHTLKPPSSRRPMSSSPLAMPTSSPRTPMLCLLRDRLGRQRTYWHCIVGQVVMESQCRGR